MHMPGVSTTGMSGWDVDAVEQHMLQLLQLPGLQSNTSASHEELKQAGQLCSASLQRQLRHSELKVSQLRSRLHPA
jgi:hypothetical protein